MEGNVLLTIRINSTAQKVDILLIGLMYFSIFQILLEVSSFSDLSECGGSNRKTMDQNIPILITQEQKI